jgi:hypothetical protein
VCDKGAEPQTVSIALDGCKPLSRIARIVADRLMLGIADDLKGVRMARGLVERSVRVPNLALSRVFVGIHSAVHNLA